MISVLLPSRSRKMKLDQAIESLLDNAVNPDNVEIIVRIDDDESDLYGIVEHAQMVVGPRFGYAGLHQYENQLAALAKGEWFLLFGDDATMQTVGWDEIVREVPHSMCLVEFRDGWSNGRKESCFPIFPRAYYDVLGEIAGNPAYDSWVHDVIVNRAGYPNVYFEDVLIAHHRRDLDGTPPDATAREGVVHHKHNRRLYYSPALKSWRQEAALKLKKAIG